MISYSSFPVAAAEASVAFGGLFRRRRFQSPAEHLTSPEGIHRLLVAISTRLTEYSDGEEGWKGGGVVVEEEGRVFVILEVGTRRFLSIA